MPENVSFKTADNLALRGWFFKPTGSASKLPCLVMAHGITGTKEMGLEGFAQYFTANLPIACLVYDHRNFGESEGEPRQEAIPAAQVNDYSDAVTYVQSRPDVDEERVGVWGSSFSGGNVLSAGAGDRRIKAVLAQVPFIDGFALIKDAPAEAVKEKIKAFQKERLSRAAGNPPTIFPVVSKDSPHAAIPTPDAYEYFTSWIPRSTWENKITLRSMETIASYSPGATIEHISPTPLLMTVADNDVVTPTNLAIDAFNRAGEPKQLHTFQGGHFDGYEGPNFEKNVKVQADFLKKYLIGA